jgi:hypothetical protein
MAYGQGFAGNFLGALQQQQQLGASQAQAGNAQWDQMYKLARMQGEVEERDYIRSQRAMEQKQAAAAAEKQQAKDLQRALDEWELGDVLKERGGDDLQTLSRIDMGTAIKQGFPDQLTADQAADNARDDARFAMERRKYQDKQTKEQQALGKFADPQAQFFIKEVGKVDNQYAEAKQRYDSAIESLSSGNATGDKAALVHLARLISDEALQEADVARNVSEGVMPSYFETAWNTVAGKGELTGEARAQMAGQFQREMAAKYSRYSQGYDRIAGSIPETITPKERRRVLQEKRTPVEIAREKAHLVSSMDPASITLDMAESMSDEQLASLPFDVITRLEQEAQAAMQPPQQPAKPLPIDQMRAGYGVPR